MKGGKEGLFFSLRTKLIYLSFVLFIFVILFEGLQLSLAYDQYYTHPALTEEMAKLFNATAQVGSGLSAQDIEWLRKGAVEEDEPARWINHFYDPVHKTGWGGKHYGNLPQAEGYKRGADMAPKDALPSIEWAVNQEYQAAYGRQFGNQTWQRAMSAFVNGDRQTAMIALGHVLHLIEDASVPDHTRDDSHPGIEGDPGSPYEQTSKDFVLNHQLTVADSLVKRNVNLPNFDNIQAAFNYIANYSNNNFFSEDTINNDNFTKPNISNLEIIILDNKLFYKDINNNIILTRISVDQYGSKKFTTNDLDYVMPSYRSHLFPEDVLTGAGVIKLFFSEADRYKQHPEQLEPVTNDTNTTFGTSLLIDAKRAAVKGATVAEKIYVDTSREASSILAQVNNKMDAFNTNVLAGAKEGWSMVKTTFGFGAPASPVPVQSIVRVVPEEEYVVPTQPQPSIQSVSFPASHALNTVVLQPAAPARVLGEKISNTDMPAVTPVNQVINDVPHALSLQLPAAAPFNSTPYASSGGQLIFVAPHMSAENPSTVPNASEPGIIFDVPVVSTSTIATTSSPQSVVDVAPPSVPIMATALVSSTVVQVIVTSTDEFSAAVFFDIYFRTSTANEWNTLTEKTTSTDVYMQVEAGKTYYFQARASDEAGNVSNFSKSVQLFVSWGGQVVISEVAWAGTSAAYPNDEWFELYNATDQPIDVKNWKVSVSGVAMSWGKINNSIIKAHSYLLLERDRDGVVNDITADIVYNLPVGFNNAGNKLELISAAGQKVDEVDCSKGWFAGDAVHYRTMERLDLSGDGSDAHSWQSNQGIRVLGRSFNGEQLHGSPRQQNIGFIALNFKQENSERHLTTDNNPYILQYYEIPTGYTLQIDPGVVIKSYYKDAKIDVYGTIAAQGTRAQPVVLTSGKDTTFSNSMLATVVGSSWSTTTVQSKDWQGIWFHPGSVGDLNSVTIKYAGGDFKVNNYIYTGFVSQIIRSEQASVVLKDSVISEGAGTAWHMENSSSTISNTIFQKGDRAIDAYDSDITMTSSSIEQFGNSQAALYSKGRWPLLDGVRFFNNNANPPLFEAVAVEKNIYVAPQSVIALNNVVITPSSTLTIDEGVKLLMMPSANIDVRGSLLVNGSAQNPVYIVPTVTSSYWSSLIFTSSTSQLNHVYMSGGNKLLVPIDQGAMIIANNSAVIFNECALVDSRAPGNVMLSTNSNITLNSCVLGFTQKPNFSTAAVRAQSSVFTIKNSQFMNTTFGMYGVGTPLSSVTADVTSSLFSGVDYPFEPRVWPIIIQN